MRPSARKGSGAFLHLEAVFYNFVEDGAFMGRAKQIREQFFHEHPSCCFCGGIAKATTQDHIPARSFFLERSWPEGYVFPACQACNAQSSVDERVMSALVRLGPGQRTELEIREFQKAISGFRFESPELFAEITQLNRVQTRQFLRTNGLKDVLADKGINEPYLVRIPGELFKIAERYGQKLGRALYYFHVGRALPKTGRVAARCFPNSEVLIDERIDQFFAVFGGLPALSRNKKPLDDQFHYKFGIASDGEGAGFCVSFGQRALVLVITVHVDEEAYRKRVADFQTSGGPI